MRRLPHCWHYTGYGKRTSGLDVEGESIKWRIAPNSIKWRIAPNGGHSHHLSAKMTARHDGIHNFLYNTSRGLRTCPVNPLEVINKATLADFFVLRPNHKRDGTGEECDWLTIDSNGNKEMFDVRVAYPNMQNKDDWNAEEMVKKKRPWHI
jgi:hypothetical protein